MAVLPILIQGESVLHSPARPVAAIDDTIRDLVRDMYDTMVAAPGVGLAAPQIGVPLRVFVFDWTDDDDVRHRGEAINPTLLISPPPAAPPHPDQHAEGCLSFPGERYPLQRAERAVLSATDLAGRDYTIDATGWLARIFQHEYDHLDGTLYVDRLSGDSRKHALKVAKKSGWGKPGFSWMPGVDNIDA